MLRAALLWTILTAIAASTMMALGHRVESLRDQKAALEAGIKKENLNLHMLNAEWAHLNRPDRLRELALSLTELRPADPARMVRAAALVEQLSEARMAPTGPHCAGLQPPGHKPTVDSNGILLATYGLGGNPI